jgi:hypothetical protein
MYSRYFDPHNTTTLGASESIYFFNSTASGFDGRHWTRYIAVYSVPGALAHWATTITHWATTVIHWATTVTQVNKHHSTRLHHLLS